MSMSIYSYFLMCYNICKYVLNMLCVNIKYVFIIFGQNIISVSQTMLGTLYIHK